VLERAADILYAVGERDLAVSFMNDVAEESSDVTAITALGQLTERYNDARAMLLIGKVALARGFAMEQYAFPDIGLPPYSAIGPQLDRCIVYSIARRTACYNAGRGRVQQWVAQHGDPRDPKVDAVDWVERIPFAETRNYVQRVMENLQVYCARFGARTATVEPNLHRAANVGSRIEQRLVEAVPWVDRWQALNGPP
jgi:hypothetical protein